MVATSSLTDCARLVTAVQEAGGHPPKSLTNILAGAHLLNAHSGASDPAKTIVDAALAGTLTEKRLNDLIATAATAQMVNTYRGELRWRSERLFVDAFHEALRDGAANELLDGLRPSFDKASAQLAAARDIIPTEQPAEQFLRTANPAAIAAWQHLDGHLATIDTIGRIAAQFGCRTAQFPMIEEYALGDGFRLDDRAIVATDGPLESDSAVFRHPDQGHRTSPWFRLPLRLHSIDSARERYRQWAAPDGNACTPARRPPSSTTTAGCAHYRGRETHTRARN